MSAPASQPHAGRRPVPARVVTSDRVPTSFELATTPEGLAYLFTESPSDDPAVAAAWRELCEELQERAAEARLGAGEQPDEET